MKEALGLIGRTGDLMRDDDLVIAVEILDVKQNFGRTDVQVTPLAGRGKVWVTMARVCLHPGIMKVEVTK